MRSWVVRGCFGGNHPFYSIFCSMLSNRSAKAERLSGEDERVSGAGKEGKGRKGDKEDPSAAGAQPPTPVSAARWQRDCYGIAT